MEYVKQLGMQAKEASRKLGKLGIKEKNEALEKAAKALLTHADVILAANAEDVKKAKDNQMKESLVDRLTLTKERLEGMADGLRQVASLNDPIGEMVSMVKRPNGLQILEKRVPLGVVGMIYESRPNVTADAFGLCFKTGNAVILRGGSDSIKSNIAIVAALQSALVECGIPKEAVQLVEDTNRQTVVAMMKMNEYLDVLIPRGGAGLIKTVVENSTVPVIETGTGNCHIYVDESADFVMALDIIENAKTQRLGVCNACESLVIHEAVKKEFLPLLYERLAAKQVVMRADEEARAVCPMMEEATEEDFGCEYLDRLISVKTVKNIDEAISHINHYNTGHSESIITKDYHNAMKFLDEIDAAAVYVNASTRFTDGNEFGLGAEIGISTQKLHARGPMGLKALTTTKFVIFGDGQIRK
ncbi:MAG: glutamate-5-semialdehyde dehydrogenase [Lachnospiraceae bacterium]|nr:glutamate-5-semialdehyde dehydrogenase [Lachnospiraceae bacterium]